MRRREFLKTCFAGLAGVSAVGSLAGCGGGYVFNNVHNIQGKVPPENIVALMDAGYKYGFYNK